jgi:hypothetical protein
MPHPINWRIVLSGFFIGLGMYAALQGQWPFTVICGVLALGAFIFYERFKG